MLVTKPRKSMVVVCKDLDRKETQTIQPDQNRTSYSSILAKQKESFLFHPNVIFWCILRVRSLYIIVVVVIVTALYSAPFSLQ